MQFSVLIVSNDVGLAANLQRAFQRHGVPTYFSMSRDRARRALDELDPEIVIVDQHLHGGAPSLLGSLTASHPDTIRLLLSRVRAGLHERDLASGLIHGVVFSHNVVETIGHLASGGDIEPRPATAYALLRRPRPGHRCDAAPHRSPRPHAA